MIGEIFTWLYIGIGVLYAFATSYKVTRMFTFRWHLMKNTLLWPVIMFMDLRRGRPS